MHKLCYYFRSLGLIWLGFDLLRLALIAQLLKHSINLSSRRYLSCYIWSWKLKLELKIKHWQCLWKLKHPVLLDLTNSDGVYLFDCSPVLEILVAALASIYHRYWLIIPWFTHHDVWLCVQLMFSSAWYIRGSSGRFGESAAHFAKLFPTC